MDNKKIPTIETQMLIRKPAEEVFQAFIDPRHTTNFWFTKSSGKLKKGEKVTWEWEMYNVSTEIYVKDIIQNKFISYEWQEPKTTVDIEFTAILDNSTYVIIKNYGFDLTGEELVAKIKDGTGGFTTVLDGLKAYLEHGINLNLIGDKYPKEITQHGN